MGYHYFNAELMADLSTDVLQPEVLVYAPGPEGQLRLVAVEWVVPRCELEPTRGVGAAERARDADAHPRARGRLLDHARLVWQPNPAGMFADWNPEVTCP